MKVKRMRKMAVGIVFLLILCISGCGTQDETALQQGEGTEQHAATNITTESPMVSQEASTESTVESSTGDAIETAVGETEDDHAAKPAREMTTAEIIKTLKVEGCPMPLPCKVKDLGDGFSLGDGLTLLLDDTVMTGCNLMYQGDKIGLVFIYDLDSMPLEQYVDMSTGYEETDITAFLMDTSDGTYEMSGVTPASTMEDVIGLLGEPDNKTEKTLEYFDVNEDTGEITVSIFLTFFNSDGSMDGLHINASEY